MRRGRRGPGLLTTAVVVGGAAHVGAKSAQKGQAASAQASAESAEMAQKAAAYDEMQQQAAVDEAAAKAVAAQAATQAPAPPPPPAAATGAQGEDPVAQLQKLADMKAQGLISDEEFAAMKAKIVAG